MKRIRDADSALVRGRKTTMLGVLLAHEERRLAALAALRQVVRECGDNDTRDSGQRGSSTTAG
jgi:hypothetical protein